MLKILSTQFFFNRFEFEFNEFEPRLKSAKNRFQAEPTLFDPRLKFKPQFEFSKFGLCTMNSTHFTYTLRYTVHCTLHCILYNVRYTVKCRLPCYTV